MQSRIEELESLKHKLSNLNGTAGKPDDQLSSQNHISPPRSAAVVQVPSINTNNEITPRVPNNHSLMCAEKTSIDKINQGNRSSQDIYSSIQKPQTTLDRSRLTIFLPQSYTRLPEKSTSTSIINNHCRLLRKSSSENKDDKKDHLISKLSSSHSIEDVANIDTELNLTLLLRENQNEKHHPLLYSKVVLNRTIGFQSLSSKKDPSN